MTLRLELLILLCFYILFGPRTAEGQCNTLTQTEQSTLVECTTALGCRPPRIPDGGSFVSSKVSCREETDSCTVISTDGVLTATFMDNFDDCLVEVKSCVDNPTDPPITTPPSTPPVVSANGQCDPVTQTELFLIVGCTTAFCLPQNIPGGSTLARFEEIECFGITGCIITAPDGVLTASDINGPTPAGICTARIFSCVDNPTTMAPTTIIPTTLDVGSSGSSESGCSDSGSSSESSDGSDSG